MNSFTIEVFLQGEKASFYTIKYKDELISETQKFFEKYYHSHREEVEMIVRAIYRMANIRGARRTDFRFEGKAVALPVESSLLRLYCLQMTEQTVIAGKGGEKEVRTYQEDSVLKNAVKEIEVLEKLMVERIKEGEITYEGNELKGNLVFNFDDNE